AGLFDEAPVLKTYAHALRQSSFWEFVPTDLSKGGAWTWEAKASGSPAPVKDEGAATGLHFPAGVAIIGLTPARAGGKSGMALQMRLNDPKRPFSAGIRFDAPETGGRYRLLALEFPGRVALYDVDGARRTELKAVALERKLVSSDWTDLAWMAEGGDLLVTVNQQPAFLLAAPVAPGRAILLYSDADMNVRQINLRK
ncbi:MAG TPA: hypothetical protein VJB14_08000, partial [Planctomycetota bacterium]|nr:hypothetical protein [Planctomycetota bacterium]